MTPGDLQQTLLARLVEIGGVESAVVWPGRPYGLVVTLKDAGSVFWMVSGASGVAPAAGEGERLAPQPMPDLGGGKVATAQVEQALLTALAAGDTDGQIIRADRFSTRPVPPAVGYGITVDMTDGWRLFVACVGTARRGEELRTSRHFQPESEV
ncbi:hypothetical protein [Kitasatospora sp. NPDC057223]|uniref:hypothetical protein n=1 Tax=Kitasatospora sp. NPDC057223 TaxID=3346055 RepID=UPI003632A601